MKENRVSIDIPNIEYSSEGVFESAISKEEGDFSRELNVTYSDFLETPEEVPVSIFSQSLSPLQALVKYLKEVKEFNFSEIGRLLSRDPRTIWSTYDTVTDEQLLVSQGDTIPLSIFSTRDFSILEVLVSYLLNQHLSLNNVAALLNKNYQTIYTVKRRAAVKRGGLDE